MNEMQKGANLLCGDAINNFKTVQSFGNEEKLVEKYRDLLTPAIKEQSKGQIGLGIAYGLTQFAQFAGFAAMFYFAGVFIEAYTVVGKDGKINYGLQPDDVFIAIFALMFGAQHAGFAAAFGPDNGKCLAAAKRIFGMQEFPSKIDAVADDTENTKKPFDIKDCKGKIEFKNVWFRYPTRKEDFVHKGLSFIVNPGESVALVGESGCGKSTFVNLLMRFYDIDAGEILLDDRNIKDINLHDLRRAVSLVMQEPVIFNYTILENILYGKTDASNEEVRVACRTANALEFIESNDIKEDGKDATQSS